MFLCVDIGNSHISIGVFEKDDFIISAYVKTDISRTYDQYAVDIYNVLKINGIEPKEINSSVISSVVPNITKTVKKAIEKITSSETLIIGPGIKTGLNIKIDNPAQLGADLAAGGAGALKYPLPVIFVDLGTATKVFAINEKGELIGGIIAAGLGLSGRVLSEKAAQLPDFSLEATKTVICKNTIECMQSGTVFGAAAMIDGLVDRFEDELGKKATVVATGGYASLVIPHCKRKIIIDENLVFKGMKAIYEKNK